MRILITGASGFVGARTCSHLEASGHEVIRAVHGKEESQDQTFTIDVADADSFSTLKSIEAIDAVVHCAGIAHRFGKTSENDYRRVNVDGTQNVAELAVELSAKTFVHLSSVLVYGSGSKRPIAENHPLAPEDGYAKSKLEGEHAAARVLDVKATRLVILRPAPIIGEGSRGNVSRLIDAIDRGRFRWIGAGDNRRSFLYVGDVARAVEFAIENAKVEGSFNVVGGDLTVAELVKAISERLERSVGSLRMPESIARLAISVTTPAPASSFIGRHRRTLQTWLADAVYSSARLEALGFRAITPIRSAVELEVEDYLSRR